MGDRRRRIRKMGSQIRKQSFNVQVRKRAREREVPALKLVVEANMVVVVATCHTQISMPLYHFEARIPFSLPLSLSLSLSILILFVELLWTFSHTLFLSLSLSSCSANYKKLQHLHLVQSCSKYMFHYKFGIYYL